MIKIVSTIILLCGITNIYGQLEAEKDSIRPKISFEFNGISDTTILRDRNAVEFEIIEFNVTCKSLSKSNKKDIKLLPEIDSITTKGGDIELLTDYLLFPEEELFESGAEYTQKVRIKVYPDSSDRIKVFRILINGDVLADSSPLTKTVTLRGHQHDASTEEFAALLALTDTTKVGTIYLTKAEAIQTYKKELFKNREKATYTEHVPCRQKRFDKLYRKNSELITIKRVKIVIENGQVSNIEVQFHEDNGIYTNKGPISLTNYDKKNNYTLHYTGCDSDLFNTYIRVRDFLNYTKAEGRQYFPSKDNFLLKPQTDSLSKILNYIGNPNSYFDVRAYTDTKGLSGDKNGLVQTEVSANFIANSNNLGRSHISLAKFVKVGISWSKFDSEFDTLKISSFDNRQDSDLLRIIQQSNTSAHVQIDLIHGSRVHDAYLTVGHRIYNTRLKDENNTFQRVFTPSFYTHIGGTIFASPRVNAKFNLPINFTYVHDQPFTDYQKKWNMFIAPEIEFTLQLKKDDEDSENERSFVFGRIKYFDMPFVSGGNYWQIQTGVEIPFNSLFGK